MAAGLDVAAGIAGLISLCVTIFQGCIKGISAICEARHMGRSVARLSALLELEQYRLLRWGESVGLYDDTPRNLNLNWDLIYEVLSQLHADLTDLKQLRERYNLDSADDTSTTTAPASTTGITSIRKNGTPFGRMWTFASSNMLKNKAAIIQQTSSTVRKLRWVEVDESKTRQLLSDVSRFNNGLQALLDITNQDLMKRGMETLLRDLVSRSTSLSDLETIKAFIQVDAVTNSDALLNASDVKQTRVFLGIDNKAIETTKSDFKKPKLSKVSFDNLSNFQFKREDGKWEVAEYRVSSSKRTAHSHVLLEWKTANKRAESTLKRRMQELTLLLSASGASFWSLKCLGFLERPFPGQDSLYAYVFEIVDLLGVQNPIPVAAPITLREALNRKYRPSLTERLNMCLNVAECVLQMHTAGWLHKSICAENLLFLSSSPNSWPQDIQFGPHMIGYDFARYTLEETESMPYDEKHFLYRHSALLESNETPRNSFRKVYDLYAAGCVLLEILLWKNLQDIFMSHSTVDNTTLEHTVSNNAAHMSSNQLEHERRQALQRGRESLKSSATAAPILGYVAFAAGDRARLVVESYLFATSQVAAKLSGAEADSITDKDDGNDEDESDEDSLEASVDIQCSVVNTLRSLCRNT